MAFGKKIKEMITDSEDTEDSYYTAEKVTMPPESGKMILLEPRAFSESGQIADHLKNRKRFAENRRRYIFMHSKKC